MKLYNPCKWIKWKDFRVTQKFWNNLMIGGKWIYKSMWYPGHMGIDYWGPRPWMKIPVYATQSGTARIIKSRRWYGNHIKLYFTQNGKNYRCTYGHLSSFNVVDNQEVIAWQQIWVMWNSWLSTAVHLHFDIVECDKRWRVISNWAWKWFFDPAPHIEDRTEIKPIVTKEEIEFMRTKRKVLGEVYDRIDHKELRDALATVGRVMNRLGATRI